MKTVTFEKADALLQTISDLKQMKQDIESGDFMKKNHRIDEDVITEGKRAMTEIINRSIAVALERFEKL